MCSENRNLFGVFFKSKQVETILDSAGNMASIKQARQQIDVYANRKVSVDQAETGNRAVRLHVK